MRDAARHAQRPTTQGFTIVELMISIAIISVLIGVLLPALGGAKSRAHMIKLLANQRESMRILLSYTMDHKNVFPTFGVPETQIAPMQWQGVELDFGWWDQSSYWGLFLQSKGYEGWVSLGLDASPKVYDDFDCVGCGHAFSRHLLTATAFADASLFKDGAADEKKTHHPQLVDAAVYPSNKIGLTFFSTPARKTIVHFLDGSGAQVALSSISPGADMSTIAMIPLPGMRTRDGLHGRDR